MACMCTAESRETAVFLLCLHSRNSYVTTMQSRDDGRRRRRGDGKSTLGELTLVGAQWGANLECDVLANTLTKHQLRLPSGKLRRWLLGTFQPCLKANHSSFGSHTVALVFPFLFVCVTSYTLADLWLLITIMKCAWFWIHSVLVFTIMKYSFLGVLSVHCSLFFAWSSDTQYVTHREILFPFLKLCSVHLLGCNSLIFLQFEHHLISSSNYQSVWECSWFNVLSISDTFLIKSLGRKLLSAAALLLLYGVISSDALANKIFLRRSRGILLQWKYISTSLTCLAVPFSV